MATETVIVDYQMGNLRSVQKGFERVGHSCVISSDPQRIAEAGRLVLPGVGAFGDAMSELRRRELLEPIREVLAADRPFLGICLGLQLLFEESDEGGCHAGLGVLAGRVERFQLPAPWKVPHMGWNQVVRQNSSPVSDAIVDGTWFYFVHSYFVIPRDRDCWALAADYGHPFCAAVARGRLFASQFHPEKSQRDGLELLARFAALR